VSHPGTCRPAGRVYGRRHPLLFVALASVGLAAALAAPLPAGPGAKPAADPADGKDAGGQAAEDLGAYYGFAEMEILKLHAGIPAPVVSDVNGDGRTDLLLVNNQKARIDLLLQKEHFDPDAVALPPTGDDVNDLFGRQETWRFRRVSYDLDVAADGLLAEDLNGDGRVDLVFCAPDGLRVVLQQAPQKPADDAAAEKAEDADAPRAPRWGPAEKIEVPGALGGPDQLAAGDLTGDGRKDLAVLAEDGVYLLAQKADHALAAPTLHYSGARRPVQMHLGDVDGDGRTDVLLLTANETYPVRVRFQTPGGQLGAEFRYEMPAPRDLQLVRLPGTDRASLVSISRQSGRVRVAALGPKPREADFPVATFGLPKSGNGEQRDFVAADVDGDGIRDLVVSDPDRAEFLLYRGTKDEGLSLPKPFPGLMDMQRLVAADLDGAGRDAIVALSLKERIIAVSRLKEGRLTFPESVQISDEPQAMDVTDVNGDGRPDLVYIARPKDSDTYFLRTVLDVGREGAKAGPQLKLTKLRERPRGLRAADIDRDGRADVMVLPSYGSVLLVRQPQAGTWEEVTREDAHAGLVANVFPRALSLAPLGPEGSTAALLAENNFARAVVFDAKAGWRVVDQYPAGRHGPANVAAAIAADLPGYDERVIVTYDGGRGRLILLARQEDGTYRPDREVEVGQLSVRKMFAGNFGGPSPVTLLLCGANRVLAVPVRGRARVLHKLASFEPSSRKVRYGLVRVGDVNHDKMPEVVLVDHAEHHVEIAAFTPQAELRSALKFKVFEEPGQMERSPYEFGADRQGGEPRALRLGDVTGDGKTDLILTVHDRILIYPQE